MIKSTENKPVSEFFSIDSKWRFVVPRYQREYVWKKDHWAQLFDDLWENDPCYFLGSMICINDTDDAMEISNLELVDGQQRLTTISLLYAAIYSYLAKHGGDDEEAKNELINLRRRLIFKGKFNDQSDQLKVKPSYQGNNFQDYLAVLQEAGILSDVEVLPFAGNRKMFRTYRYFVERLEDRDGSEKPVFSAESVQSLLEKLSQATMVKIEVSSNSDAFTLFESLNNRGIPLSALDLIKNKLLAHLENEISESIDANFKRWTGLLENLTENYAVQERFIRQYYNAFKHKEEIAVPKASLATRSNIIWIYEKLIKRDAEGIFSDLLAKSKLYNKLIEPMSDSLPIELAKPLVDLDHIGGAGAYVLLLYLQAERPQADLAAITELLVRYFVRRNLTDFPPTRDLARIFIDIIGKVAESPETQAQEIVFSELLIPSRVSEDDLFRTRLSGHVYQENAEATRFVLCSIEEHQQTHETMTDLWKRDQRKNYVWTVEHIFPQGPTVPSSWVAMIADGDTEKAKELLDSHSHTLGNLTMSGYNPTLGNKSFEDKRDRKDAKGKAVGYKNGLMLNKDLAQAESWTIADIEARTEQLVELAMGIFSLDSIVTGKAGKAT